MYNVLIVDDESWALKGIRNIVNWEKLNFTIAAETTNSVEALGLIKQFKPDVIVSDIRMPEISGIDLIKAVRELGLKSEMIFVSGYADFEYAKEALKYGAFYYILKPIKREEVFEKLSNHLLEKSKTEKSSLYLGIIEKLSNNENNLEEVLKDIGLDTSKSSFQAIVTYGLTTDEIIRLTAIEGINSISIEIGLKKNLLVVNSDFNIFPILKNYVEENEFTERVSIGISSPCSSLNEISKKFKEADMAMHNSFIKIGQRISLFSERKTDLIKKQLDIVISALEQNVPDVPAKCFDMIVWHNFGIVDITYFYNALAAYINVQHSALKASKAGVAPISNIELEYMDYDQIVRTFQSLENMLKSLKEFLAGLTGIEEATAVTNQKHLPNETFKKLLVFVDSSFTSDIYLAELSEKFHLNSSYISELFKKVTGKTLSKYILDLRLEYACSLLINSSMSIFEIAVEAGYNDYCYFNKIFKKTYNSTPARFRKSSA